MWHLPGIRTRTGQPLDIALPTMAVEWLQKLRALGVEPHVAERWLNHELKGVEGVYNRHDCFEERRRALEAWGQLLLKLERQGLRPKKPADAHRQAPLSQEA